MEKISNNNILINETFIVDHSIYDLWVNDFKSGYIKELIKSGLITDLIFSKIITDYNPDGISYAMQYKTNRPNIEKIQSDKNLLLSRKKIDIKYKDLFASFTTFLEIEEI